MTPHTLKPIISLSALCHFLPSSYYSHPFHRLLCCLFFTEPVVAAFVHALPPQATINIYHNQPPPPHINHHLRLSNTVPASHSALNAEHVIVSAHSKMLFCFTFHLLLSPVSPPQQPPAFFFFLWNLTQLRWSPEANSHGRCSDDTCSKARRVSLVNPINKPCATSALQP